MIEIEIEIVVHLLRCTVLQVHARMLRLHLFQKMRKGRGAKWRYERRGEKKIRCEERGRTTSDPASETSKP
jgi:hypothetical protein